MWFSALVLHFCSSLGHLTAQCKSVQPTGCSLGSIFLLSLLSCVLSVRAMIRAGGLNCQRPHKPGLLTELKLASCSLEKRETMPQRSAVCSSSCDAVKTRKREKLQLKRILLVLLRFCAKKVPVSFTHFYQGRSSPYRSASLLVYFLNLLRMNELTRTLLFFCIICVTFSIDLSSSFQACL